MKLRWLFNRACRWLGIGHVLLNIEVIEEMVGMIAAYRLALEAHLAPGQIVIWNKDENCIQIVMKH